MNKRIIRMIALVLCTVIMASVFAGCAKDEDSASVDAVVDAAVKAALDAAVVPTVVTIEVDGKQITVEDAANKSLQQMLDQADITLNEGDIISVPAYQTMSGNITVKIIRNYNVTIVVEGEETVHYIISVNGGTVTDALAAAGVELAENQTADQELDKAVEDGMVITVTTVEAEPVEEEEETEEVPEETRPSSGSSGTSSPAPTQPKPTEPKPTEPKPTEPTKPAKTVVSKVKYEDCDGSGHGVWVITYSDGSQEEVPF